MTYKGKVVGGVVVLEESNKLPEGTVVRVERLKRNPKPRQKRRAKEKLSSLSEKLLRWAGRAKGLPSDYALQHDHYLYGKPKR